MTEPVRTCYPINKPCPACGGQMASDGRREWCMACLWPFEVPEKSGDPCICGATDTWHPECYRETTGVMG